MNLELKFKLVTTTLVGGWVDGWTNTKLMIVSTQIEVELGNIRISKDGKQQDDGRASLLVGLQTKNGVIEWCIGV